MMQLLSRELTFLRKKKLDFFTSPFSVQSVHYDAENNLINMKLYS